MQKRGSNIKVIIVLFLIMTACNKDYVVSDSQAVLFQVDYLNYAWGYQHSGLLIDREGNVLTYNHPENWNFHDEEYILNETQVAENISKCSATGKKISDWELSKYSKYINNIASSKVTAPKNTAADAGTTVYLCYEYSEASNSYKGYLIKMEGDYTSENLNFYSKKVTNWLKDINADIPK